MSTNYRQYQTKEQARRAPLSRIPPLRVQLAELFEFVLDCEADWRLDDRINRALKAVIQRRSW
jgi:hypothetical protein